MTIEHVLSALIRGHGPSLNATIGQPGWQEARKPGRASFAGVTSGMAYTMMPVP